MHIRTYVANSITHEVMNTHPATPQSLDMHWTGQVERTDQNEFCNYDIIRFRFRVRVRLAKFNLVHSFYLIPLD